MLPKTPLWEHLRATPYMVLRCAKMAQDGPKMRQDRSNMGPKMATDGALIYQKQIHNLGPQLVPSGLKLGSKGPRWVHLESSRAIWARVGSFGLKLVSFGLKWSHLGSNGLKWAHVGLVWAKVGIIWAQMGSGGLMLGSFGIKLVSFGLQWAHLGSSGLIWAHVGLIWTQVGSIGLKLGSFGLK